VYEDAGCMKTMLQQASELNSSIVTNNCGIPVIWATRTHATAGGENDDNTTTYRHGGRRSI
jgi:hypothetical protein